MPATVLLNLNDDVIQSLDRIVSERNTYGTLTHREHLYVTSAKSKAEADKRLAEIRPKRRVTRTSLVNEIAAKALREYIDQQEAKEPVKLVNKPSA